MTESNATARAMNANLLTLGEAQQKQCRQCAAVGPSPMGMGLQFTFPLCVAGQCAHWRWHSLPPKVSLASETPEEPRGCCGLAGHP